MERDLPRICLRRRGEGVLRIAIVRQQRLKPRSFEPSLHKLASKPIAIGSAFSGIKIDQYISRPYNVSILNVNGANDSALERLDHFAATTRNHSARSSCNNLDLAENGPGQRAQ